MRCPVCQGEPAPALQRSQPAVNFLICPCSRVIVERDGVTLWEKPRGESRAIRAGQNGIVSELDCDENENLTDSERVVGVKRGLAVFLAIVETAVAEDVLES